jgi:hypothetical protein
MADGLRETLVGHVIPGEGSRNPGVEASRAGALGPLPDPPVPPPAGQNQP